MKIRIEDQTNGIAIINAKVEEIIFRKDDTTIVILEKLTPAQAKMFDYLIYEYFKRPNIMVAKDIDVLITSSKSTIHASGNSINIYYNEQSKPSIKLENMTL